MECRRSPDEKVSLSGMDRVSGIGPLLPINRPGPDPALLNSQTIFRQTEYVYGQPSGCPFYCSRVG